jgi:RsiW-degrading membrane proteinase PrsW (M82 family)
MLQTVLLITTIVLGILWKAWTKKDFINKTVKFILFMLFIANLVCFIEGTGYIVVTRKSLVSNQQSEAPKDSIKSTGCEQIFQ